MTANRYEERLGTEPMLPLIMRMAMPSVLAQIVNLLYNLVDRVYIGHIQGIGTAALAGVGITTSVIILISAFAMFVGGGAAPLAAIALGQDDRQKAGLMLGNGFILLVIFTVLSVFVTYCYMDPILTFSGATTETLPIARDYLAIYLTGTFFVMVTAGLNSFINVQGRPAISMWAVVVGALLNIILDPIFIFLFEMGVRGAAVATVISQAASALWILYFLFSPNASLRLESKFMRLDRRIIWATLGLGLSPFIMASTESLVGFVLNSSLSKYGVVYVGALAIMQSAMQMVSAPITGFAQGFIPIVSYNFGHNNVSRVKECSKIVITILFFFNLAIVALMMAFPGVVAKAFTSDPELIATTKRTMPLFLAGMTIFGLQRACQNIFVSLNQAKISIFIALLRKVFLLIPLALILPGIIENFSPGNGVYGVFAAEAFSDATAAICCILLYLYFFPRILAKNRNQSL